MQVGLKILLVLVLAATSALIVRGVLRSGSVPPRGRPVVAQPVVAAPPLPCPPVSAITREEIDTQALQDAMRRIVREELQAARQAEARLSQERQTGLQPAAAPSVPTAENNEALRQSRSLVLNAISTRRWGAEQAAAMRELLPQLTAEQQAEVFKELNPALNSGDIVVATEGSLF